MGEFTPLERVQIVQAAEDYAADWYADGWGLESMAWYICEKHLQRIRQLHSWSTVVNAVAEVVEERPDLLTESQGDRVARKQARQQRAEQLETQATAHFRAGCYDQALQLVDEMELADPTYDPPAGSRTPGGLRGLIQNKAAAVRKSP